MRELFVSALNLTDKGRARIMAGTPFIKSDMVEGTFKSLANAGDIVPYVVGNAVAILPVSGGRPLGGPPNETTAAAINPSKNKSGEALDSAELAEKAEITKKLQGAGIRVVHNTKLATLRKKLADHLAANPPADPAAPETKGGPGGKPQRIWDFEPEDIQSMPETELYAKYKERCEKFEITPDASLSEEDVRAKMSSEYSL